MHQLKLKLVSITLLTCFIPNPVGYFLECAALVKEGKVYGVGTEDMDVRKKQANLFHPLRI